MRLETVAPALLLLLGAAAVSMTRRRATGLGSLSIVLSLLASAYLWRTGRLGNAGTLDADSLSLLFTMSIVAALGFATLARPENPETLSRLLLAGALAVLAVSTRDLFWAVAATLFFVLVMRGELASHWSLVPFAMVLGSLGVLALLAGGTDLAVIAASDEASSWPVRASFVVLATGLLLTWLLESRAWLRGSEVHLVTRMSASFALLLAVAAVLARIAAWAPSGAFIGSVQILALVALAVGALGMIGSTRIATFITALALSRAGLALLALLGGVQSRVHFLFTLAAAGISLLLVAFSMEKLVELDDVERVGSLPARLCLTVGVFSACALPPFPGFLAVFPLSGAILSQGYSTSLAVAAAAAFLANLGSMRIVARAWDTETSRASSDTTTFEAIVGLAFAIAALWFLGILPARFLSMATRAAMEMF